jgi:Domain of unknown function (DUF1854)
LLFKNRKTSSPMNILDPEKIAFARNSNGMLDITLDDKTIVENIHCVRLFPLTDPKSYISIVKKEDNEISEIGIIKNLKQLSVHNRDLVKEDINFRYFVPEIKDVAHVTHLHGMYELDVVTERGNRQFYVRNARENVHSTENGPIIITDVENCRYKITDLANLGLKARAELDKLIL